MLIRRISLVALAMVVFLSGTGFSLQGSQIQNCATQYIIQNGQTLASIAKSLGTNWQRLASSNGIPLEATWLTFPGQKLCVRFQGAVNNGPKLRIQQVVRDTNVTIRAENFAYSNQFDVVLKRYNGTGNFSVGTVKVIRGGTLNKTFNLPVELRGIDKLEIRLQSRHSSRQSTTQWFWNMTSSPRGYSEFPRIVVTSVVRNQSVTFSTSNMTPNTTFEVLMALPSEHNRLLVSAGTLSSGAGGTLAATFNIPASFQNKDQIILVVRNLTLGYVAYDSFSNTTH